MKSELMSGEIFLFTGIFERIEDMVEVLTNIGICLRYMDSTAEYFHPCTLDLKKQSLLGLAK